MNFNIEELKAQNKNEGNFQKIMINKTESGQVELYLGKSGQGLPPHSHESSDQYFHHVAGTGTVTVDGETSDLEIGHIYLAPQNVEHSLEAGSDDFEQIVFTSPSIGAPTQVSADASVEIGIGHKVKSSDKAPTTGKYRCNPCGHEEDFAEGADMAHCDVCGPSVMEWELISLN